jgi:hypothetical protein
MNPTWFVNWSWVEWKHDILFHFIPPSNCIHDSFLVFVSHKAIHHQFSLKKKNDYTRFLLGILYSWALNSTLSLTTPIIYQYLIRIVYMGHFHWFGGGVVCRGSQGFHSSIFRANSNSFSAWTITSSIWPHPIFFSSSNTFFSYKSTN